MLFYCDKNTYNRVGGELCTLLGMDRLFAMCFMCVFWEKYMSQQVTEETLNLKYHRDIYQDDNHSLMMQECILVDNCGCALSI